MSTNQNNSKKNIFFMNLALHQASRSLGNTKGNPAVGCVIVKNNTLIGAGYTSINGRPHAEHNAIKSTREVVKNSELYVTLEPCSNYGKTSPCVQKIIRNQFKKVYFSIRDPDKRSFNKSSIKLRKSKVIVNIGALYGKIKKFYKSYYLLKKNALPFVTCKLAVSKDLFTIDKKNNWITNKYSRSRVLLLRSFYDCIMTSSQTIISDDPLLTCRIYGLERRSPSRIILDNKLRVPAKSKVFKDASKYRTIVFYNKNNKKKMKKLKALGVKIYKIAINKNGDIDLKKALIKAQSLGFSRIFLESGIKLATSFLENKLVNDLKIFIAAKNLNRNGQGCIKKYFRSFLRNKKSTEERVNLFNERLISYKIK